VLSTLHTNDSAGAVTRLLDMGVAPYKIAACRVGVIAQRLVRKVCPHCRAPHYPPAEFLESLRFAGDKRRSFVRGEGCRECFDTGFNGRTGIYEVLVADAALRSMIARNVGLDAVRNWFREEGHMTLAECALLMAEKEITSLDEVSRVASFD